VAMVLGVAGAVGAAVVGGAGRTAGAAGGAGGGAAGETGGGVLVVAEATATLPPKRLLPRCQA